MPVAMYNTGLVQSARNPVLLTAKFSVDAATGKCTTLNGKRVVASAGVGTGVVTLTLPQTFTALEYINARVVDSTLSGAVFYITQGETTVNGKTTIQLTLAKGAPLAAVTTGVFTVYFSAIGVTN